MARSATEYATVLALTPKLFELIFAGDELPKHYPKHLRRPLARPGQLRARSVARASVDNAVAIVERVGTPQQVETDEDCDGSDVRNVSSISHRTSSLNGTTLQTSLGLITPNVRSDFKVRVKGGRAAVPKKVGCDLDSEDEIIKDMKDAGHPNDAVVEHLVKRGGTKYDPKTIATRYARIKKQQFERDEVRKDDEFSDFHEDEDSSLLEAFDNTVTFYEKEFERLQNDRWKKVAAIVQEKIGKAKYSAIACRNRVVSIQDGTGIVPQEKDPNPEQRQQTIASEVAKRIVIKADLLAAARREYTEKVRIKQEQDEEAAALWDQQFAEEVKKAKDEELIRHQKQVALEAKIRAKDDKEERKAREKEEKQLKKEEAERAKREHMAARAYEREHAKEKRELEALEQKLANVEKMKWTKVAQLKLKQDTTLARDIIRRVMRDAGLDTHAPLQAIVKVESPATSSEKTKGATGPRKKRTASEMADDDDEDSKDISPLPKKVAKGDAKGGSSSFAASSPAEPSPRFRMTTAGLINLLRRRKLPATGTKQDLVRRLETDDMNKTKEQLKQMMTVHKLGVGGTKLDMIKRLAERDVRAERP